MSEKTNKQPDLKIAIISDPHVGFTGHINPNYYGLGQPGDQDKWWEYALRWFKDRGVDVVVVPGDMANSCAYDRTDVTHTDCAIEEMARLGKIFREVFKDTDTQLFCVYGNHDALAQPYEILNGGDKTPWEDAFGEPYAHTAYKQVKGYSFVGAHWGREQDAKELLAREALKSPDKPVFYVQHGELKETTCDTYKACLNGGAGIENVRDFENVIALFGHTHYSITDERTIWQSADENAPKCTVISCSSFNYSDSKYELIRGENLKTKHALYLTVTGKDICVERLSFWTDEMLALAKGEKTEQIMSKCTRSAGADWRFTIGGEKVMDLKRREQLAFAPEFPEGAIAGLARSDTFVVISFPAALPLPCDNDILHSYYVEAWEDETNTLVSSNQINTEFHIDHSADHFSEYYQIVVPYLKPNTAYTFKVYARDCFQKLSTRPIIHKGRTLPSFAGRLM